MLPKVGPAVALKLAKLGIYTVRDLLFHWPRTWLDATTPVPIATIAQDQTVVIEGRLSQLRYDPPIAKRRPKITALITDEAGDTVPVVWHNQSYLRRVLANGQRWLFLGKTVWNWQRRALELSNPQRLDEQAVLAVYPETAGISSAFLRSTVGHALARVAMPDPLGPAQAVSFADAVRLMHRPPRLAEVAAARRRLALDELAMVQYVLREQRLATTNLAPAIAPALPRLQALVAGLPFQLTRDQRRISWDIIRALNSPVAVRHVLQGDVGTGKTIVALLVAVSVLEAGYDVCWMAPTQLLARQLADRLRALMGSLPFDCDLVTAAEKPAIHHRPTVYVGTHALLSMVPRQLGLVVIDEQHRFGVKQQDSLGAGNCHVLTMTATPIPRALLLALYGERGSSQLVERPALQQPVATVALPSSQREQVAAALVEAVGRGEQGFIITPRIEAGEDPFAPFPSLKAVLQRYQRAAPAVRRARACGPHPRGRAPGAQRGLGPRRAPRDLPHGAVTQITTGSDFSWAAERALLDGLPGGGLNIAHEAVDRHAAGPLRDRVALRWLGRDGSVRDTTYGALAAETNRFARLLADEVAPSRLLHGSDFPFPAVPWEFSRSIGAAQAAALQWESNLIRRDYGLKEALGIGRRSAERAYEVVFGQT